MVYHEMNRSIQYTFLTPTVIVYAVFPQFFIQMTLVASKIIL